MHRQSDVALNHDEVITEYKHLLYTHILLFFLVTKLRSISRSIDECEVTFSSSGDNQFVLHGPLWPAGYKSGTWSQVQGAVGVGDIDRLRQSEAKTSNAV